MNELRFRPKGDYLQMETWQGVYVLTQYWKKEMDFYKDELRFLNGLISKYFIWMTKEENVSKVQEMVVSLKNLENEQSEIDLLLTEHLFDLNLLMQNIYGKDEQEFRDKHVQLEEKITDFTKTLLKARNFNIY